MGTSGSGVAHIEPRLSLGPTRIWRALPDPQTREQPIKENRPRPRRERGLDRTMDVEDRLAGGDVFGLEAFRPLLNLELHHLPLGQRLVAIHLNRGEMNENVLSRLALDEPIPLCCVKPLHNTLFSAQLFHSSFKTFAICRV